MFFKTSLVCCDVSAVRIGSPVSRSSQFTRVLRNDCGGINGMSTSLHIFRILSAEKRRPSLAPSNLIKGNNLLDFRNNFLRHSR
ncbi:hypothetical protein CBM2605_A260033 [Cupriavidus neocaledonicus]|uniref:Uncharacterized protein n=1 Tax=Cupriavidus neocaledonicus TaxID=1040979 RepID=A0ABY1V0R9_9BURK|nr:hypothetical protein CBM2605_A260033 [Cupriavidus neocaledonicus]